jgi:hypothetical protein
VTANIDSARANLAGTFVNAFVNAGFGNDKLLVEADEGNSWIYKNKDHGAFSSPNTITPVLNTTGRYAKCDCILGLELVVGYRYWSFSCR